MEIGRGHRLAALAESALALRGKALPHRRPARDRFTGNAARPAAGGRQRVGGQRSWLPKEQDDDPTPAEKMALDGSPLRPGAIKGAIAK